MFLIFVYQRYIYPVDKTRVNEYGLSQEMLEQEATGQLDNGSGDDAQQQPAIENKPEEEAAEAKQDESPTTTDEAIPAADSSPKTKSSTSPRQRKNKSKKAKKSEWEWVLFWRLGGVGLGEWAVVILRCFVVSDDDVNVDETSVDGWFACFKEWSWWLIFDDCMLIVVFSPS